MEIIGIDVGTTHTKVGVFTERGKLLRMASQSTISHRDQAGRFYFAPDELFQTVIELLDEVSGEKSYSALQTIGITSMAETGVLLGRTTGLYYSDFIPWFDKSSTTAATTIAEEVDGSELFLRTGLRPSYKYGLAKLLWWKAEHGELPADAIWLSVSDYIAYRFTGKFATDYTLALRTLAFRMDELVWDEHWIRQWGIAPELFPRAQRSGQPVGTILPEYAQRFGWSMDVPVAISGHDHLCGAVGAGIVNPSSVFNSVGTAETLLGLLPSRSLTQEDYSSGLSYGQHVIEGQLCWMGSLSASGGSLEWFCKQWSKEALSYSELEELARAAGPAPTGILYYPYLAGGGASYSGSHLTAALLGLTTYHTRAHMAKAFFEGTAFEAESIRRRAEGTLQQSIQGLTVAGGGVQNSYWLQIKADVYGSTLCIPEYHDVSLLGAALVAGIGCGLYSGVDELLPLFKEQQVRYVQSNEDRAKQYRRIFEQEYLHFQLLLRQK